MTLERNPLPGDRVVDAFLRLLAIRILYVLAGKVAVNFPGSTRAAPSRIVFLDLLQTKLFREGDRGLFPFTVQWKTWEVAIRPVLEDPDLQLKVVNNREILHLERYEEIVQDIEARLEIQFRDVGLLPTS
jgi:hypothetical protein